MDGLVVFGQRDDLELGRQLLPEYFSIVALGSAMNSSRKASSFQARWTISNSISCQLRAMVIRPIKCTSLHRVSPTDVHYSCQAQTDDTAGAVSVARTCREPRPGQQPSALRRPSRGCASIAWYQPPLLLVATKTAPLAANTPAATNAAKKSTGDMISIPLRPSLDPRPTARRPWQVSVGLRNVWSSRPRLERRFSHRWQFLPPVLFDSRPWGRLRNSLRNASSFQACWTISASISCRFIAISTTPVW